MRGREVVAQLSVTPNFMILSGNSHPTQYVGDLSCGGIVVVDLQAYYLMGCLVLYPAFELVYFVELCLRANYIF